MARYYVTGRWPMVCPQDGCTRPATHEVRTGSGPSDVVSVRCHTHALKFARICNEKYAHPAPKEPT